MSDLATPWTAAHQAPLPMGFSQARVLEWGAIAFSSIKDYIHFKFDLTSNGSLKIFMKSELPQKSLACVFG